jgi:hypothetical protein
VLKIELKAFPVYFIFKKAFIVLRGNQTHKLSFLFLRGNLFEKKTLKHSNKIKAQGGIGTLVL